jgi:hypothetical protein
MSLPLLGLPVEEAAEFDVGLVVISEGEAAEEVEHGLGLGEGEAHLAGGVHVNEVVGREGVDALVAEWRCGLSGGGSR